MNTVPLLIDLTDEPNGFTLHEMMRRLWVNKAAYEFNKCSSIIVHPIVYRQILEHENAMPDIRYKADHITIMGLVVRQCDQRTVTDEPGVFVTRLMFPDETEFCQILSKE